MRASDKGTDPSARAKAARARAATKLDELDEQILWELIRDARMPNNALADKLKVSPSTTLARIRALRDSGVLVSSHAVVDYESLGFPLQAMIAVRLRAQSRPQLKDYATKFMRLPCVLNAYFVGGDSDFILHVACTSSEHLRDFVAVKLSTDPGVASTHTNIVFEWLRGEHYVDAIEGFSEVRAPIRS